MYCCVVHLHLQQCGFILRFDQTFSPSLGSVPSLAAGLLFGGLAGFGAYNISQNSQNIWVSLGWYIQLIFILIGYFASQTSADRSMSCIHIHSFSATELRALYTGFIQVACKPSSVSNITSSVKAI